jgi:hypothetical protein
LTHALVVLGLLGEAIDHRGEHLHEQVNGVVERGVVPVRGRVIDRPTGHEVGDDGEAVVSS